MICVNINGLRQKRRRTLLGKLLHDLHAGICVVTETNLREEDLKTLDYDYYNVATDYC